MAFSLFRVPGPLVLAVCLAASAAPAQVGFERAMPADCLAYIGIEDVRTMSAAWHAAPVGRLFADPELEPLRAMFGDYLDLAREQVVGAFDVDPFSFPGMIEGGFGLGVVSMSTPGPELRGADRLPISICLLAEMGGNREACEALIGGLTESVVRKDPSATLRTEQMHGIDVTAIIEQPQDDHAGLGISLRHAFSGDVLVLSIAVGQRGAPDMARVLAGLSGEATDSLAARPSFADSAAAGGGRGIVAWLDVGRLVNGVMGQARAAGELPSDLDSVMAELGLREFTPLSLRANWDETGSYSVLRQDWSGEGWAPKLLSRLCRPKPFRTLAWVPAECRSMQGAQVDPAGLFDASLKMLLQMKVLSAPDLSKALSKIARSIGFSVREDLLELFDGEMVLVTSVVEAGQGLPGTLGEPVNVALLLGLSDGRALTALLEDISRRTGFQATRMVDDFEGVRVYHLVAIPGFTLHYAVMDDLFVASLSNEMVRDVLRLRADPELPSLARHEEFRRQVDRLAPGFGWLGYSDAAPALKNAIESLRQLPAALAKEFQKGSQPLPEPLQMLASLPLPDPAVVDRYVHGASVVVGRVGADGLVVEAVGP